MKSTMIDSTRPLLDMRIYPDHEMVGRIVDIFAKRYGFISVGCIGTTMMSRSIYSVDIGSENAEKEVLYIGTHNATDWMNALQLLRFINEYCEYYKSGEKAFGTSVVKLFNERRIRIVPLLNADGVCLLMNGDEDCILKDRLRRISGGDYSNWRGNARGVELRNNYGVAGRSCSSEYTEPEVECESVCRYLRYNDKIEAVLSFEMGNEGVYCPNTEAGKGRIHTLGKQISGLAGYSLYENEKSRTAGTLADWYTYETGKPAFQISVGKEEYYHPKDFHKLYSELRRLLFLFPLLI